MSRHNATQWLIILHMLTDNIEFSNILFFSNFFFFLKENDF